MQALYYNPVAVLILFCGIAAGIWWLVDRKQASQKLYQWFHSKWPAWTIIVAVVVTLANWIWNLYKYM